MAHGLEVDAPTVVSWLNTVHYLTGEAVASALAALSGILASGSRLIVNYSADVPFSQVQLDYVMRLLEVTSAAGESRYSNVIWTGTSWGVVWSDARNGGSYQISKNAEGAVAAGRLQEGAWSITCESRLTGTSTTTT